MKKSSWDYESRDQLENLLNDGYNITRISEMMGLALNTVRSEIKRGTTEDEYKDKRFNQYRAMRATLAELFEGVPDDEIRGLLKELQSEARRL